MIGIKFKGKLIGHACAGFPTAEGRTLYFDSTPSAGHVSRAAHEARVELGKPYRRADGGELAAGGAENLPITQIIPVSRLDEIASSLLGDDDFDSLTSTTRLVVVQEKHLPVIGIEYAGPDTLTISEAQLARWNQAAEEAMTAKTRQQEDRSRATQAAASKLAANALEENQQLADRGDAYGELRMGERYLTGDGMDKDISKARDYLQRAAEQGSQTAVEELINVWTASRNNIAGKFPPTLEARKIIAHGGSRGKNDGRQKPRQGRKMLFAWRFLSPLTGLDPFCWVTFSRRSCG